MIRGLTRMTRSEKQLFQRSHVSIQMRVYPRESAVDYFSNPDPFLSHDLNSLQSPS
jgi:hypothetical protein